LLLIILERDTLNQLSIAFNMFVRDIRKLEIY